MMAGGWFRMYRGWQTDRVFEGDRFSRRDAWAWLIENAAWEPHSRWFKGHRIDLARGEIITSERDLCTAWRWDRQPVRTFLRRLETDQKLTRALAHGLTKLSLLNYDRYQTDQPADHPLGNPELTQDKPTIEEGKEGERKEEGGARYAFFGRVIRLIPRDLEQWQRVYHAVPDIMAELTALDAWLEGQSEAKRKGWFHTVSGALNRKHQEILGRRADDEKEQAWPC